ncbi:outer membrane lipoprotein [Algiphilus aromaticivorans]|uniref:glycine zipper 2TM domain-containing protein n=1 Tax=Algiphilus aromaticivorans TaxID=382454 RepID=UPI0006948E77|nr:glycine zipper 2TM domain-containing protein [Algiphilus aromaticivorans]
MTITASRIAPLRLGLGLVFGALLVGCTGEALESQPVDAAEEAAEQASAPSTQSQPTAAASARPAAPRCDNCGTVASITPIERKGEGTGAGAIGGAAAGGVIGHQIGGGSGKKIATVVGAIAGGYAGHKAEERIRSKTVYEVAIRMDNGQTRRFEMVDAGHLREGQKVAIHGDSVVVRN